MYYSFDIIQIAPVSTFQVVLIDVYRDVSVYLFLSVLCLFVCACVCV